MINRKCMHKEYHMAQFTPVYGTITSITPLQAADGTQDCTLLFFIMTQDMGPVTFTVTPLTYVEAVSYTHLHSGLF